MVSGYLVGSFTTSGKSGSAQDNEYEEIWSLIHAKQSAVHPIVRPGLGDAGTVLRRVPLLRGAYRDAGAAGISGNKGCRGEIRPSRCPRRSGRAFPPAVPDRKSTRLNCSNVE